MYNENIMIKKHKTTKLDNIFAEDVVVIPSKTKGFELTEDQKVIFEQIGRASCRERVCLYV